MKVQRFEGADLAATGQFLSRTWVPTRLRAAGGPKVRALVQQWTDDDFSFTELFLDGSVDLATGAVPNRLGLLAVHSGTFVDTTAGRHDIYRPGAAALVTDCGLPRTGKARAARCTLATFAPALLGAQSTCGADTTVRLAGPWAEDPVVSRRLTGALDYLRESVLGGPHSDPLPAATGIRHLAAVLAPALPRPADGTADSREASDATLRRAMRFIEDHAHRPITLEEVAGAAFVTPRAVQYAFQRHLGLTPLGYLRQVRVDRAHHELETASPGEASVTAVAARWGFVHPGRFAAHYRARFGHAPSATLHRQTDPTAAAAKSGR